MQEDTKYDINKKIIMGALAQVLKELRGEKSLFSFAAQCDLSIDIISKAERGLKNPQMTTLYKIAEGSGLTFAELVERINSYLPDNFSLLNK